VAVRRHRGSVEFAAVAGMSDLRAKVGELVDRYRERMPEDLGASILIKPNLNSNMNALTGNTTDLRLLAVLVDWFKEQGYRNITIAEGTNSGFYREGISVIGRLGVDRLAEWLGVRVVDLNYGEPVMIEFGGGLEAEVAREVLEADFLVNVPKMKTHFEVGMSVCMKNLMGCLVGQTGKKKTHQDLAGNILRLNRQVRPDLHVVDALVAMQGLGPTRGTPVKMGLVLAGDDPIRLDLACARLARFDRRDVRTLARAEQWGLVDQEDIDYVDGLALGPYCREFERPHGSVWARFFHHPRRQRSFLRLRNLWLVDRACGAGLAGRLLFLLGLRQDVFISADGALQRPTVREDACRECGKCAQYCPVGHKPWEALRNGDERCLRCLYCYCVCPNKAIEIDGDLGFFAEQVRQYDEVVRNET
jgi:uncharacterized protein (DUF362 family)/Pyruvate/2-oxoacid:ferredoxin oxidoreductase delta subunit